MTTLTEFIDGRFVIAGTGSRSFNPEEHTQAAANLAQQVQGNLNKFGDKLVLMSGGAQGWDAQITIMARQFGVPYVLCLPNKGYLDYYWGRQSPEAMSMLIEAEYVEYTMEDVYNSTSLYLPWPNQMPGYKSRGEHSNFVRNRRMVELADAFWVFNPASRGTEHCLTHIKKADKPYKILG